VSEKTYNAKKHPLDYDEFDYETGHGYDFPKDFHFPPSLASQKAASEIIGAVVESEMFTKAGLADAITSELFLTELARAYGRYQKENSRVKDAVGEVTSRETKTVFELFQKPKNYRENLPKSVVQFFKARSRKLSIYGDNPLDDFLKLHDDLRAASDRILSILTPIKEGPDRPDQEEDAEYIKRRNEGNLPPTSPRKGRKSKEHRNKLIFRIFELIHGIRSDDIEMKHHVSPIHQGKDGLTGEACNVFLDHRIEIVFHLTSKIDPTINRGAISGGFRTISNEG
jgi:hypothetical protein